MIDHVSAYARLVVSGRRIASEAERLCCQRHLDDLKKSRTRGYPYKFDIKESEFHLKIASRLTICEGESMKALKLRGFQQFIIGSIFGWVEKGRNGKRRFREAYVSMGRQNGKSFLSGVLANDFATFSGYREGRIFCTATKQDQANIVWDEVRKFIQADHDLSELYSKPKAYKHEIHSLVTGTTIKAIGRDTKTADGFRSILAIVDEYHQHPTNQMYSLMLNGQITVKSPLTIAITTAGFNLNYPCYGHYKMCKGIIAGTYDMPHIFVYIAEAEVEADDKDALKDPKNWAKANPLIAWKNDTELSDEGIQKIEGEAASALTKGGADLVNFETKRLNIWVTNAENKFVDIKKWDEAADDLTIADMQDRSCYLGIDLSEGGDLTSVAFVFPLDNGKVFVESHSFIPVRSIQKHEQTDNAPYRRWVNNGLLTITNGADTYGLKTDYKAIIAYIAEVRKKYNLKILECGYDNRNAAAFLVDLDAALGCDLTEIIQSAKSLNDTTKDFQLSVEAGIVIHNKDNELLTWSMNNAEIVTNYYNEIKIDKTTRSGRIDPCDAMIDAWKCYFTKKSSEENAVDINEVVDEMISF